MQRRKRPSPNFLVEFGPLLLFFGVNAFHGIYAGTAVLVAATVAAVGYSWFASRRVPAILVFGCGAVVLFGALTLWFEDETFIKVKPTVVSLIIAGGLLMGLLLRRNPLKALLGESMGMELGDRDWRLLTLIWVAMFGTVAAANELAWRNLTTDGWVAFKVFGLTGITLAFAVVVAVFLAQRAGSRE